MILHFIAKHIFLEKDENLEKAKKTYFRLRNHDIAIRKKFHPIENDGFTLAIVTKHLC